MEYAYATLLLDESGKEINEENLTAVLEASGYAVETSRVKALVAALEDVDLDGVAADVGVNGADRTGQTAPHDRTEAPATNGAAVDPPEGTDEMSGVEPGNEATTEK